VVWTSAAEKRLAWDLDSENSLEMLWDSAFHSLVGRSEPWLPDSCPRNLLLRGTRARKRRREGWKNRLAIA